MKSSIAAKLTAGFGAVAAVALLAGLPASFEASRLSAAAAAVEDGLDREHRWEAEMQRLEVALLSGEAAVRGQLAGADAGAARRFDAAGAEARAALGALGSIAPEAAGEVAGLTRLDAAYRDEMRTLLAMASAEGTRADALAGLAASARLAEIRTAADGLRDRMATDAAPLVAAGGSGGLIPALGTLLVLVASLGAGFASIRFVARPVGRMAAAMEGIAAGGADVVVPGAGRADEIGAMAKAVEAFRNDRARARAAAAEVAELRRAAEAERATTGEDTQRAAAAMEAALSRLADGDLSVRVEDGLPGRYARLAERFNAATERLGSTIGAVAASVSTINDGVTEIGHAADDLARRTEQQAASLDTTATALDEITATVKHSAENAVSVAGSVAAARLDTERSGEVMREAVDSMNGIQKSSQQIARIIGVIDEIAFQTNLLALNAGVEAARAGEAGRGFAVVALEVRALAQRSSEAAKEIKALIGTSTAQVGAGVSLVGRAGEALSRIAAQVTQIDSLVQEIAGSAKEQSIGIADVNEAVNKMDRVTQQNAAMVEETTAATLSLRSQTEELGRLVASFRVEEGRFDAGSGAAQLRRVGREMREAVARAPEPAPRARPAPVAVAVAASGGGMSAAMRAAEPQAAAAQAADLGWEEF